MSEWKGPWRCEKCGFIRPALSVKIVRTKCGRMPKCDGELLPYDRRVPDPEKAELVEALRDLLDSAHEPPGWAHRYYQARGAALVLLHRIKGGGG